ncbi:MAG TPA: carboxypeptidase-like regulatory domain-containing protein [Thermoanaerobaculia bacterium]
MFVFLLLRNARLLVSLGLVGRFYYLTLIPLGLSAASFLFGALRSIGIYRGKLFGGVLELGGPVVIFALVIIGGFYFPPPGSNFPLTVYVHGPAGPQDLLLRNQGAVLLDLGGDRRSAPIGDKGQAFFPEIPANFRGQEVNIALDASGYERSDNNRLDLAGTSLYLGARRKSFHITGNVRDKMDKPVIGATVSMADISTTSIKQGYFDLAVPSDRVPDVMVLRVSADRYETWNQEIIPNGSPVTVVLSR